MSHSSKITTHTDPFFIIHNYRHLSSAEKADKKRKKNIEPLIVKAPFILTRKMAAEI